MPEAKKPSRSLDRRTLNAKVPHDRRGSGTDRRNICPSCGSAITRVMRKTKTGSVLTVLCTRCDFSQAFEQQDADQLVAKLTWELALEKRGPMHYLAFPHELLESLSLGEGDKLVLKPVTSTVGSLDMRWMLEVKKRQTRA